MWDAMGSGDRGRGDAMVIVQEKKNLWKGGSVNIIVGMKSGRKSGMENIRKKYLAKLRLIDPDELRGIN